MYAVLKTFATKIAVVLFLCVSVQTVFSQGIQLEQLISVASMPQQKFDPFMIKKGFSQTLFQQKADSNMQTYQWIKPSPKRNRLIDSSTRILQRNSCKEQLFITYQTSSLQELQGFKAQMAAKGFYSNSASTDSISDQPRLYQHQDFTIKTCVEIKDTIVLYAFKIYKKSFPDLGDIVYADDLLTFTSHEYLSYFFGEQNLKKDFFFLSGDEVTRCSVLFPNTNKQVVFLWKDEVNRNGIANLLFGGQQKLKSTLEDNASYVAESVWVLKSGIHAGMPLYQLRILNGNDFTFYGGNSPNTGSVLPNKTGKLDFKKEDILLGCVNCDDNKFNTTTTLQADEAIADGRIVFVLSVMLNPPSSTSLPY